MNCMTNTERVIRTTLVLLYVNASPKSKKKSHLFRDWLDYTGHIYDLVLLVRITIATSYVCDLFKRTGS